MPLTSLAIRSLVDGVRGRLQDRFSVRVESPTDLIEDQRRQGFADDMNRRVVRRRAIGMAVRMGGMDKLPVGREAVEDSIVEVRVALVDSEPSIWRQLELRSSMTLDEVHQVLQTAFGWENAHLHRFMTDDPFAPLGAVDGELHDVPQWLPRQHCEEPAERPEEEFSLDQLLALGAGKAFYVYDFGDSWLHRFELVARLSAGPSSPAARLVAGARRGPLEDSGGMPGYEDIIDALADKSHPDHAEHVAWVAELTGMDAPFDPAFLDIDAVNHALSGRR